MHWVHQPRSIYSSVLGSQKLERHLILGNFLWVKFKLPFFAPLVKTTYNETNRIKNYSFCFSGIPQLKVQAGARQEAGSKARQVHVQAKARQVHGKARQEAGNEARQVLLAWGLSGSSMLHQEGGIFWLLTFSSF